MLGASTTLPGRGGWSSPIVLPASGGTVSGATSGTSALAGSCGCSGTAPEPVYQWTPAVSGRATIHTCGAGTTFDTVLYLRSGACAGGPEVAAGCNGGAQGIFSLAVTQPASTTTTTADPPTTASSSTTTTTIPTGTADEIHWTVTGQTSISFDWRGSATVIRYGLTRGATRPLLRFRP